MSAKHSSLQIIVWHFIQTEYERQTNVNIPLSLKYLIRNYSKKTIDSSMITNKEDLNFMQLLLPKLPTFNGFKLLYKASQHKYSANKFHELCDGHGPTLCIIQSNFGNIFGGYSSIKWTTIKHNCYNEDENAFLFLIRSTDTSQKCPILFECIDHKH
eukprot:224058_1